MTHRYWRIRKDAGLGKWCAEYSTDLISWYRGTTNRSYARVLVQVRAIILNMAGNDWGPGEAPKPSERAYKLTSAQREELTVRSALKGWNKPQPAKDRVGEWLFRGWHERHQEVHWIWEGAGERVRPDADEGAEP